MELEAQGLRAQLRGEEERLERLSSNMHLTKQQIDFFTQETQRALEGIKDANWRFTKEVCGDMGKIKSPCPEMAEVSEKFLFILEQQERSWKTFRAICHNYGPLKTLMNSVSADRLTDEQLTELLPIWKNQQTLLVKLSKVSKGGSVIAEWISSCVEYKLRKETLTASLRKLPELEKKIRKQLKVIAEKNALILTQEEKLFDVQAALKSAQLYPSFEDDPIDHAEPVKSISFSQVSATSTSHSLKQGTEERAVGVAPLRKGTATGGLLIMASPRGSFGKGKSGEFPNFGSGELYSDAPLPVEALKQEDLGAEIILETENELVGCCRSKFFCY